MSKIINKNGDRNLSSYVETEDGKYYWVNSALASNGMYELIVLPINAAFEVTDWNEVYTEYYSTYYEMRNRHDVVCENLEKCLSGDNENEEDKDKDSVEMAEILQKLDLLIEKFEQLQKLVVESEDEA